jgi:hypothetical protein
MDEDRKNKPHCDDMKDCQVSFGYHDYIGEGASEGLSRGILVFSKDRNLTGEGMGIGSIALRKCGYTYFSSNPTTRVADGGVIERRFYIDTWRKWARKGYSSAGLTRFIEFTADCYMALPWAQPVLCVQSPLIGVLSLHPVLEPISPLARADFRYSFTTKGIFVSCTIESCTGSLPRIFILNELDGDLFCRSFQHGSPAPPPPGWRTCPDHAVLSTKEGDICFWITGISVGTGAVWRTFWGRERTDTLRWAGFEVMIDPMPGTTRIDCSYVVRFGQCTECRGD